jgi:hypothetical protein
MGCSLDLYRMPVRVPRSATVRADAVQREQRNLGRRPWAPPLPRSTSSAFFVSPGQSHNVTLANQRTPPHKLFVNKPPNSFASLHDRPLRNKISHQCLNNDSSTSSLELDLERPGLCFAPGIEPRYPRALLRSAYGRIDKVKVISGEWISREQPNRANTDHVPSRFDDDDDSAVSDRQIVFLALAKRP